MQYPHHTPVTSSATMRLVGRNFSGIGGFVAVAFHLNRVVESLIFGNRDGRIYSERIIRSGFIVLFI